MSLTEFRDRVRARLTKLAQDDLYALQGIAFRPAAQAEMGVVPASTMEEIAVQALNSSTRIRVLAAANAILDEEYKKLVDPSPLKPPDETAESDSGEGPY